MNDDRNMWLAPFKFTRSRAAAQSAQQSNSLRVPNFIQIMFDSPKCLSAIRFWNYSKTPSRGVSEFELLVDDKQVFRGFISQAPENPKKNFSTTILFNPDRRLCEQFAPSINFDPGKKQDVVMINERKIVSQAQQAKSEKFVFHEGERPVTKHGG